MNFVRLYNLGLKYQTFTPSGCTDIEIKKIDFGEKQISLYDLLLINQL